MNIGDILTKGGLAASLANTARRESLKEILIALLQRAKKLPTGEGKKDSEKWEKAAEKLAEKEVDKIIEIASPLNVAGAVTKEFLFSLTDKFSNSGGNDSSNSAGEK